MLVQLFPRMHRRYSSLRLLGPMLDDFVRWLQERGYPRIAVRRHVRAARRLEQRWHRRGIRSLEVIGHADFQVCPRGHSQDDPDLAAVAHVLETYFEKHGLLPGEPVATIPEAIAGYRRHLTTLRGLAASTIADHLTTASELLRFVANQRPTVSLQQLAPTTLEGFVQQIAARVSRATLQHLVAHLRSFLRWLAAHGHTSKGLDSQIDTPRVYRQEQLPRALRWDTVRALLQSIDRTTSTGRHDYAMLLLIATYGLRSSEVTALSLRHSAAVHLLKAGVDLVTISHWLGHAGPNTTHRYAAIDLETKRAALTKASPTDGDKSAAAWRSDATILQWLAAL